VYSRFRITRRASSKCAAISAPVRIARRQHVAPDVAGVCIGCGIARSLRGTSPATGGLSPRIYRRAKIDPRSWLRHNCGPIERGTVNPAQASTSTAHAIGRDSEPGQSIYAAVVLLLVGREPLRTLVLCPINHLIAVALVL
jgi:hypothetical protein